MAGRDPDATTPPEGREGFQPKVDIPGAAPKMTAQAETFWTAPRQELREWFARNAPSLGELYEGAVIILYGFQRSVPGWTQFVAHAVREVRNRLPAVFSEWESGKGIQYKNRLDALQKEWERAGLPLDASIPARLTDTHTAQVPEVPLPRLVYESVAVLLRDHAEARERPIEAAARFFETVVPGNRGQRQTLQPVLTQWLGVTGWFQTWMHDSGQQDGACDREEFLNRFEQFELILMALVRDFFKTTDEIDEVLEDANS